MSANHPSRTKPDASPEAGRARTGAQVHWHRLNPEEVLRELGVDGQTGLSETEVARRRSEYGRNELVEGGAKSPWLIFWGQLTELMVVILIVAAVISALLKDYKDAIAIAVIVVLNALLGFTQEYRAEKAIFALKKLAAPFVKVRRDRKLQEIPATGLVPGDVLLLEAGSVVPADCRVLESADLQTQEASLTGESQSVWKNTASIAQTDAPLGDRHNMAYMGTFVIAGRGQAIVTDTGMRTELGRIAGMIREVERERTPLQRRLSELGKRLAAAALVVVALIFTIGWIRGEEIKLLFLTAVSIGVAAIPEGLPAVVTIALTLGAQRMLRRKALTRKLSAVETLGSVTVICSDKTGTLTENRMAVAFLDVANRTLDITKADSADAALGESDRSGIALLLVGGALCNDAVLQSDARDSGAPAALGDPTETALLAAASRFGVDKSALEHVLPRAGEIPFTSERKRMTTIHRVAADLHRLPAEVRAVIDGANVSSIAFAKGSVETLIERCGTIWVGGNIEDMDSSWRERIRAANDGLAANGIRVLGVGFRPFESVPPAISEQEIERDLTFIGMTGLIDPPRTEAASAVMVCKEAGIRPVMITGDHPLTAQYIARQLGIDGSAPAVTGTQLGHVGSAGLRDLVESTSVYARVAPEHKLGIVEGLQSRGDIVAMTGDGVNDAPALKKADIGVAMGITGTDVAKEAADMVLLDDNFATIVAAVEEGRVIYDNIRKFIRYILATNSGEICVMLFAPLFGMPLPLLPLQILWMNLVTDGLPALALTAERPESDVMRRAPRHPEEGIFAHGMGWNVIWVGLLMGLVSLGVGYWYWHANDPRWQTILFTTLTLSQMSNVLAVRSERLSLFKIGILSNKLLLGAVGLTVALQCALVYAPFLQGVFRTTALPARIVSLIIVLTAINFFAVELDKWVRRRRHTERG